MDRISIKYIGIDPGPTESAYCILDADNKSIIDKGKITNEELLNLCRGWRSDNLDGEHFKPYIEMVESFGMAVGKEVFETVFWIGRFYEALRTGLKDHEPQRISRREIKLHLCNSMRAKDANIRQSLIDRYGEPGTKKNPGMTYGISKDVWSALAVATVAYELDQLSR